MTAPGLVKMDEISDGDSSNNKRCFKRRRIMKQTGKRICLILCTALFLVDLCAGKTVPARQP